MHTRKIVLTFLFALALVTNGVSASAQESADPAGWTVPRTADGQPDLQGVWANNSATPFERPVELGDKATLSASEVEQLQQAATELFNGETDAAFGDAVFKAALARAEGDDVDIKAVNGFDVVTGNYNQFWLVDREFDSRTSVVTNPANGRIPELTTEAKARMLRAVEHRRMHPADGPEDLPYGHRCVNFGLPKVGAGYNSYHQILQTPDHVVIFSEMAHDARVIPLDGRPHADEAIRQWNGDARGHWEGDTLVVETTNFSTTSEFRGARENLELVERYTRVGPDTLRYEFTVSDPTTWTRPWSGTIPFKRSEDAIFEYACHEGNDGMPGTLSGHRAQEREAALSASK